MQLRNSLSYSKEYTFANVTIPITGDVWDHEYLADAVDVVNKNVEWIERIFEHWKWGTPEIRFRPNKERSDTGSIWRLDARTGHQWEPFAKLRLEIGGGEGRYNLRHLESHLGCKVRFLLHNGLHGEGWIHTLSMQIFPTWNEAYQDYRVRTFRRDSIVNTIFGTFYVNNAGDPAIPLVDATKEQSTRLRELTEYVGIEQPEDVFYGFRVEAETLEQYREACKVLDRYPKHALRQFIEQTITESKEHDTPSDPTGYSPA